MTRQLWTADDGSGDYDIGEGYFFIATGRRLREDGRYGAKAYEAAMGKPFDPLATALMFSAAPDLLAIAKGLLAHCNGSAGLYVTSSEMAAMRAAVAKAERR